MDVRTVEIMFYPVCINNCRRRIW